MVDPLPHFVELRARINERLPNTGTRPPPWLYGALGNPRSDVMFICEYPSQQGVEAAGKEHGHLGIEAQWKVPLFREVLVEQGLLKRDGSDTVGGWRCYITNAIKQIYKASEWGEKPGKERKDIARRWFDLLKWEISQVDPQIVFCVGGRVWEYVPLFQSEGLLVLPKPHRIWSYSARGSRREVHEKMSAGIRQGLARHRPGS